MDEVGAGQPDAAERRRAAADGLASFQRLR
jgi:hypothetical protein